MKLSLSLLFLCCCLVIAAAYPSYREEELDEIQDQLSRLQDVLFGLEEQEDLEMMETRNTKAYRDCIRSECKIHTDTNGEPFKQCRDKCAADTGYSG